MCVAFVGVTPPRGLVVSAESPPHFYVGHVDDVDHARVFVGIDEIDEIYRRFFHYGVLDRVCSALIR